ncbi:hypothetical protein GCM10011367_17300 [Marinicauda pacifica]|uniref:Uncharacterized protein n=2 Tax=Marinicauda pacifica TaxID=1133559 RepID=A0A4S2HB69_9PROT|nr:hypothetical protein [Marinicauda pacifica]TGY93136.1 hypothetical protein E5162_08725 [Marinicauda pacifica]GGE43166.1 hypothetical protein GCM10011367_17300 [Marinicauda pacifica]
MMTSENLRAALVEYRETESYRGARDHSPRFSNEAAEERKLGILRRVMIEYLVLHRPIDFREWLVGLPAHMKRTADWGNNLHRVKPILAIMIRHTSSAPRLESV